MMQQNHDQRPSQWVRDFISGKISGGEWAPGQFLPSERDIATQLGVHRLTVNSVVKDFVREGRLERRRGVGTVVRAAAGRDPSEMKVAPQPMVGLITDHPIELNINPFYGEMVETLRRELLSAGYFLLPLGSANELLVSESAGITPIWSGLVGFFFLGPVPPATVARFRPHNQPVVFVGFSEGDTDEVNISSDDEADSFLVTQKMIELGHRQIVHINAAPPFRMVSRLQGFLRAMESAGLEVPYRYVVDAAGLEYDSGAAAMEAFCKTGLPYSAVYGGNDMLALGALDFLEKTGRNVPGTASVVGFDGIILNGGLRPQLTTMQVDRHRMALDAARAMIDLIRGRPRYPTQVRLRSRFIPGATLAPPVTSLPVLSS